MNTLGTIADASDRDLWLYIDQSKRKLFLIFSIGVGSLLSLYLSLLPDIIRAVEKSPDSVYVSVPFFIFWTLAALIFVWLSGLPLGYSAWNITSLRKNIPTLLIGTATLLLVATGFDYLVVERDSTASLKPSSSNLPQTLTIVLLYMLFVPVQEFVARGVLLGALLTCLKGRFSICCSILCSALIYSILHLYLDTFTTALVFLPGLVWGWMYWKTRSLLLVSCSHTLCGLYAIFFLRLL